jgi:hypothetical protein
MPTSIFLARLIGPVIVAIGIGLLADAAVYRKMAEEGLRSHVLIYLSGLLMMTAGLATVLSHNVWAADWRVLITLIGWLGTIGGAVRIVIPQQAESVGALVPWASANHAGRRRGVARHRRAALLLRLFSLTPPKRETRK